MQKDYFTLLDILPALLWLVIIVVTGFAIRNANTDKPHYKYYMPNLFAKLFFSLAFACVYIFYYGGGDTVAYYDCSVAMNNLFFKSPELYFEQLFSPPDMYKYTTYFDQSTGYPPTWIYKEPEGFFVSKIISLLSFFTLKSYLATSFVISFLTAIVSWKLFEMILSFKINNTKLLAVGLLLLPSLNFWCSGISKDAIVLIASFSLITNLFKVISPQFKYNFGSIIIIIISAFVISQIRLFILAAIILPILFSIGMRVVKKLGGGAISVVMFRTIIFLFGLALIFQSLSISNEEEFLQSNALFQEASVIQRDFQQNKIYGSKQYDLGQVEFTPLGLLKTTPLAIITGVFRPFIWEAISPTLLMNGLESLIFIYFTFRFFRKNIITKWKFIKSNELLIFCLLFVIIIALITGMTSILYGVLVRLRAPLIPFFIILLTLDLDLINQKDVKAIKTINNTN